MKIDWPGLCTKARSYRALQAVADPGGRVTEVVFCGLQARLSELVSLFPAGGGATLTVYADTLIVDSRAFDAAGVVVVARCIDLGALEGSAMQLGRPAAAGTAGTAVAELLVGQALGGRLRLAAGGAADPALPTLDVPAGMAPLQAATCTLDGSGPPGITLSQDAAELGDLLHTTWALNSLKASLTAATWLADSDAAEERETARSMLRWVRACTQVLAAHGAVPGEVAELQGQAAALWITLDVAPGVCHVPVLSPRFYGRQVQTLLQALAGYEAPIATLDLGRSLQQAVAAIGATLDGVSQDETGPLQAQLDAVQRRLAALQQDVLALSAEVQARQIAAGIRLDVLKAKITSQHILQAVVAAFTIVGDIVKAAAAMSGEDKEPGDAVGAIIDALKNAKTLVDLAGKDAPGTALLDRALHLGQAQAQLMTAFATGMALSSAPAGTTAATLPLSEAADRADPATAWDNYIVEAEAALTDIKEDIGTDTGAGDAQVAANAYLATLKTMAQYAKALSSKLAVAADQGAQVVVLQAQIRAARSAQARWKALQANAASLDEQVAALKGLLQMRCDSVRRSLFAAWLAYRNAYFYLEFQEPPRALKPDMSAADLTAAFASVDAWLARLRGDTADARQLRLPADDVSIAFRLRIVSAGQAGAPGEDVAVLTPRSGRTPASLAWAIPAGDAQLAGVLPDAGLVAVWIREARFFVEGVTPNAKGNVIVEVSTSGAYENGFGPGATHAFVTQGLVGSFGYEARAERVYNPWAIATEVYATPTPFTQWRLVFDADGGDAGAATWLRMELRVAYRRRAERAPADDDRDAEGA